MDGRECGRELFGRRARSSRVAEAFLTSEEETKAFAKSFARDLRPGDVVCLQGELGSGKTSFVKGIATAFGIDEALVTSPTFTYLNLYQRPLRTSKFSDRFDVEETLAHFDLYRLRKGEEFFAMGFDEYLEKPYIACIEWPNILEEKIPKGSLWVFLSHHKEGRALVIEKG